MAVWLGSKLPPEQLASLPALASLLLSFQKAGQAFQISLMLGAAFGLLIVVSLLTQPLPVEQLNPFFARLHTPVSRESGGRSGASVGATGADTDEGVRSVAPPRSSEVTPGPEDHSAEWDYEKASAFAYRGLQRFGLEIPRMDRIDWGGFLLAWGLVGVLVALLMWLARLGA